MEFADPEWRPPQQGNVNTNPREQPHWQTTPAPEQERVYTRPDSYADIQAEKIGVGQFAQRPRRRRSLWLWLIVVLIAFGLIGRIATPFYGPHDFSPPHGGTLALNDPLRDNSRGYGWAQGRDPSGDCEFIGGAYHDIDSSVPDYFCYASRDFTNFAFQVDMQINRGLNGGIVFGADQATGTYLIYEVSEDGRFGLWHGQHLTINSALVNATTTPVINQGLGKTNTIAVVVKGNTITLYINRAQVAKVVDSAYSHGSIGVMAGALMDPTGYSADVAYTNAKVWTF